MNLDGYKRPKRTAGDLRTPVAFYGYKPKPGPYPGESEEALLGKYWAAVDEVWAKDVEIAKSTGTLSDITLYIRDPQGDYLPSTIDYFEIDARGYFGKRYRIRDVSPDLQDKRLVRVIGGLHE